MDQQMKRVRNRPTRTDRGSRHSSSPGFFSLCPNNEINHSQQQALLSVHTGKYIDIKGETISFYDFLCALFYVNLNLIISKKTTQEHREFLAIKSLFKVKWSASDIPRGLATGLASEYKEKIPCIEIPCGPESGLLDAGSIRLAAGSLQYFSVNFVVIFKCIFWMYIQPVQGPAGNGQDSV